MMNNNHDSVKSEIIDLTGSPCLDDIDNDQDLQRAIRLSMLPADIGLHQCYLPGHFLNNGTLKLIQSHYDVVDDDKISFDDILQADAGLLECVLSSYVIDEEWLLSKILHVPRVTIALHSGKDSRM